MMGRWSRLVEAAAIAQEVFEPDELEAFAAANPPTDDELAETRSAYIEAAGYAAVPVILRAELGYLRPVSSDPRYLTAKMHWQTHVFMRRHRASL